MIRNTYVSSFGFDFPLFFFPHFKCLQLHMMLYVKSSPGFKGLTKQGEALELKAQHV